MECQGISMEYRGIGIEVHRKRFFAKIPMENAQGRTKDSLMNEANVRLQIFEIDLLDMSFIFEFRSILDEFILKRLGQYSKEDILNENHRPLGNYHSLTIHRDESLLVLTVEDLCDEVTKTVEYNIIHAKTLHSILSKAIHLMTV